MTRALWVLAALLSHWRRHPLQLATLLIGLIAATALWSGVQALNEQARASYARTAALFGGQRAAMLESRDGQPFAQDLFVALRRAGWPVSPVVDGRIQLGGKSLRLVGVEPVTLPLPRDGEAAAGTGDLAAFLLPPGRALIAPETLADLGLHDGDTPAADGSALPPLHTQAQTPPGIITVDIGVAQRILRLHDRVSRLVIGPESGQHTALEDTTGDRLKRVEPAQESDLERLTDSFHLNLTAFGLLSFVVGLFIVNAAIGLAFEQRLPTVRTLRALGVSARLLGGVLVFELVGIALIAGLAGLVCGYLIAAALLPDVAASLRGLYGAQIPGALSLRPMWWFAGIAISVGGALAAASISLIKVARLPLLAAAQPAAWRQAQQRMLIVQCAVAASALVIAALAYRFGTSLAAGFVVLAAILLAAALTLPMLLSIVLRSGERGARGPLTQWFWADGRQQLSGLSLALMALLLALSANVGVSTMVESFSKTFTQWLDGRLAAEIYFNARDDAQGRAITDWLNQRNDVEAVLPSGRADTQVGGWPIEILGFADHPTYRERWPLLEASSDAWDRLRDGRHALISEQLARRLNVALGDRVVVPAPGRDWPLEIVAIYADYGNPRGQLGVDVEALFARYPQAARTRFGVRARPEAVPALVDAIRERFGLDDRNLADQATVKTESLRIFNRTFAVTAALNAFTLGVAGIALLTSLLTLSQSRLPQLAPLWAVGLTRSRLALIELGKTMALALLTALLALPLGLVVAWCLIAVVNVKAFGWRIPFHVFPAHLIALVAVAVLAAFTASLLPIVRLMRMQPADLVKVFVHER